MAKEKKNNKQIYAQACNWAVGLTVLVLELYSSLELDLLGFFNISGIFLYIMEGILFILHWLLFSGMYQFLRHMMINKKYSAWKKSPHEYNIEGSWLHIHDKGNVRIGVVDIKQDFNEIIVNAENIQPQTSNERTTRWRYIGAEFTPDKNTDIKLMGCYFAQRNNHGSKQGIHLFREFHRENGIITRMSGEFGDALNIEVGHLPVTGEDQTGKIHLFRMTPELQQYLNYESIDTYEHSKLKWILQEKNEKISCSEYVCALREIYYKNQFQEEWKQFKAQYSKLEKKCKITQKSIENALYNMLAFSMFADNRVDTHETEMMRALTGLSRSLAEYPQLNKDTVLSDIREILDTLSPYADVLNLFKSLLSHSCRSIILCNAEQSSCESSFLSELEDLIKGVCHC